MDISAVTHTTGFYAPPAPAPAQQGEQADKDSARATDARQDNLGLSEEEQKQLEKLKARDREVRAHEQAHLAAAAGLAMSGASYTYQRGPDGANYAIGGEVKIDTSPGSTPEETIQRAQRIRAAAMAPAEPSGADRAVAAKASQMEAEARAELATTDGEDKEDNEAGRQDERQLQLQQRFSPAQDTAVSRLDVMA